MNHVYVWKLNVTLPEGVGPDNPPEGWEPMVIDGPEGQESRPFSWPTRRHYLSAKSAEERAAMLRRWGCTVTIDRSRPVRWHE